MNGSHSLTTACCVTELRVQHLWRRRQAVPIQESLSLTANFLEPEEEGPGAEVEGGEGRDMELLRMWWRSWIPPSSLMCVWKEGTAARRSTISLRPRLACMGIQHDEKDNYYLILVLVSALTTSNESGSWCKTDNVSVNSPISGFSFTVIEFIFQ